MSKYVKEQCHAVVTPEQAARYLREMSAPVVIRNARDDYELDEILAFDRLVIGAEVAPSANTDWWGAWDGPELVGYAGSRMLGNGAYFLSRAGVVESHRGRGLQRRLIRARVQHGRRLHALRIVTYTAPHNAPSLNNLFRCGFRVYEPEIAYAGSVVYMRVPV